MATLAPGGLVGPTQGQYQDQFWSRLQSSMQHATALLENARQANQKHEEFLTNLKEAQRTFDTATLSAYVERTYPEENGGLKAFALAEPESAKKLADLMGVSADEWAQMPTSIGFAHWAARNNLFPTGTEPQKQIKGQKVTTPEPAPTSTAPDATATPTPPAPTVDPTGGFTGFGGGQFGGAGASASFGEPAPRGSAPPQGNRLTQSLPGSQATPNTVANNPLPQNRVTYRGGSVPTEPFVMPKIAGLSATERLQQASQANRETRGGLVPMREAYDIVRSWAQQQRQNGQTDAQLVESAPQITEQILKGGDPSLWHLQVAGVDFTGRPAAEELVKQALSSEPATLNMSEARYQVGTPQGAEKPALKNLVKQAPPAVKAALDPPQESPPTTLVERNNTPQGAGGVRSRFPLKVRPSVAQGATELLKAEGGPVQHSQGTRALERQGKEALRHLERLQSTGQVQRLANDPRVRQAVVEAYQWSRANPEILVGALRTARQDSQEAADVNVYNAETYRMQVLMQAQASGDIADGLAQLASQEVIKTLGPTLANAIDGAQAQYNIFLDAFIKKNPAPSVADVNKWQDWNQKLQTAISTTEAWNNANLLLTGLPKDIVERAKAALGEAGGVVPELNQVGQNVQPRTAAGPIRGGVFGQLRPAGQPQQVAALLPSGFQPAAATAPQQAAAAPDGRSYQDLASMLVNLGEGQKLDAATFDMIRQMAQANPGSQWASLWMAAQRVGRE